MPNGRLHKRLLVMLIPMMLALVTILACVFYSVQAKNRAKERAYAVAMDSASEQIKTLNATIDGKFTTLDAYARVFSLETDFVFDSPSTLSRLGTVSEGSAVFDLSVIDASGTCHLANGSTVFSGDRVYFTKAISGAHAVESLESGRISGLPRFMLAVPLTYKGEIIGAVAGRFDETNFRDLLISETYSRQGYSFLTNSTGKLVINSDHAMAANADNVFDTINDASVLEGASQSQLAADLMSGASGYTAYSLDGGKRFAVYAHTGINDWTLFTVIPGNIIDASVAETARTSYAITISVALFSLGMLAVCIILQRRSTRHIARERLDFRAAATQSNRMLRIYDVKGNRLVNIYRVDDLSWRNSPEEMIEAGLVAPETADAYLGFYNAMRSGVPTGVADARLKDGTGAFRWYHAVYTLMYDDAGRPDHAVVTVYDNTEQMQKELAYELRRNELAALAESSSYYLEADLMTGQVESTHGESVALPPDVNDAQNLHRLIEWSARNAVYPDDAGLFREFFDKTRLIALYAQDVHSDSLEYRVSLNGDYVWYRVTVQMVKHPYTQDIKAFVVFNSIEAERAERAQLIDMASNDSLTGLLNREATMREIERYLQGPGAGGTHALFMIDIDNFKEVNDTLGHQAGDSVLASLSAAICRCFRESDIVGRIGGDEFFAFMKNVGKLDSVTGRARELILEMQYVYSDAKSHIDLSASIGITVYSGDVRPLKPLSLLYAEADAALYKAKAIGKNCYAFADEPAIPAAEPAPTAIRGVAKLSLKSLLNNLGSGIEIYHGSPDGRFMPLYSNESFLKLIGGISETEYNAIYAKDALAYVHPDDRAAFSETLEKSLSQRTSFQHTYRIGDLHGTYTYVTVFANFVWFDDGSFDLYAVYSDAEHAVREHNALSERYRSFQDYRLLTLSSAVASFHLDLSSDHCCDTVSVLPGLRALGEPGTADGFLAGLRERVDSDADQSKNDVFTRQELITRYRKGETSLSQTRACLVDGENALWLRLTADLAENPDTRHIEALISFSDVDREMRLGFMVQRMLRTDYEFLGQINVKTGRLTVFGRRTGPELSQADAVDVMYDQNLPGVMRGMLRDEFYEDALAALRLEKIISALEETDTYVCAFPTKRQGIVPPGFRQWRCCYIDQRKSVIMISRTDVTDTMAGEYDALTGLYNQQGFYRRVRAELDAHPGTRYHICRMDFDDFKLLNDTLGFSRGDQLLRDFGVQLRRRAADGDTVFARLESDHFACFRCEEGRSPETMISELAAWMEAYPLDFALSAHMGVYRIANAEMAVSAMCDRALLALKSVKRSFSRRVGYYSEALRDRLVEEQTLSGEMEEALTNGQFEVYLQPQVNYDDGSLIGAEALVRWNHPIRGLLPPNMFIPLFERNGFITTLDEYVWEQACRYLRRWLDEPERFAPVPVAVNISRIDIYNQHLTQLLTTLTERHGIPPHLLKLEITETAYMQNPEQLIGAVKELRAAGFSVEMDDFGSGYSSLNTLKDVPVDTLKLDLRFLTSGIDDQRGGNILSSVIRMAHWLKLPVIAEGVETAVQADYLKSLGCFYMQGYFFARPMPVGAFEALLTRSNTGQTDRYAGVDLEGAAAYWDPSAQTALLFNSFVGGAAILEYQNGNAEIVRANDEFYAQLETTREAYLPKQLHTLDRFEDEHRAAFANMLEEAIKTGKEAECEVQSLPYEPGGPRFWTHARVRLLARNRDRCLLYLSTENITGRVQMEARLHIERQTNAECAQNVASGKQDNGAE